MRILTILISLLFIIGLISGCAQQEITQPADTTDDEIQDTTDTISDSDFNQELDDAYVENKDLDVGELI